MAASTGVAPASLGLKNRDPELLDDKAVKPGGGQNPLTSVGRTAPAEFAGMTPPAAARSANSAERAFFTKNTHRRPSRPRVNAGGLDGRGIWRGRRLIRLGSAVKPRKCYGKSVFSLGSRKRFSVPKNKKPTSGLEVGRGDCTQSHLQIPLPRVLKLSDRV